MEFYLLKNNIYIEYLYNIYMIYDVYLHQPENIRINGVDSIFQGFS